jgi:FkbM family methyltransferase
MKKILRYILQQVGLFERFRYGRLFRFYEGKFRPSKMVEAKREVQFYRSFLPHCKLVFDIGGYDGHKTEAFLDFSEQVVVCEPDLDNFKILRNRFRTRRNKVFLENVAVGARESMKEMFIHQKGSAFNTLNEKFRTVLENDQVEKWNEKIAFTDAVQVVVTTLDKLINRYGQPDFIKIDTEGFELEVIRGLSAPVKFLSIECLLPDFRSELLEILDHLGKRSDPSFNIAIDEKLLWKEFRDRKAVEAFIDSFDKNHFELVIKNKSFN